MNPQQPSQPQAQFNALYHDERGTPHNLGLYRLQGFSGRHQELLTLHTWLTDRKALPAICISGEQGNGKSAMATAAAWNHFHHFTDGIIRVGAAGADRLRIYDIVRTMDTVFGTTMTRFSEERWGISILEQLYRRRRLLMIDELAGATEDDINTLVDIIGHLHEAGGLSRIVLIDRNFSQSIAALVQHQVLNLSGLNREDLPGFIERRAPQRAQQRAMRHMDELYELTRGQPLMMRLIMGLMIDYSWDELSFVLEDVLDEETEDVSEAIFADQAGTAGEHPEQDLYSRCLKLVAFVVENLTVFHPEAGPLLDRLVSAAGGASMEALRALFWSDLGDGAALDETLRELLDRALLDQDGFEQRVLMHPMIRRYLSQNVVMFGEEWERQHARYYVDTAAKYQYLPLDRWSEVDADWGNIYLGLDWCAARIQRLLEKDPQELLLDAEIDQAGVELSMDKSSIDSYEEDLRLARNYALSLAHYAFWRHPPGVLRWLAAGAVASLALWDMRNYGWILLSMGRQLFFQNNLETAIHWFERARVVFDERDLLDELVYVHTDIGTTLRILDRPQQALEHFDAVIESIAELGNPTGLPTAYMNLGSAYYSLNNYKQALHKHRRALRVAMRRNDSHAIASAHNNMGLVMESMERWDEAEEAYASSLREFRRLHDETGISACYNNLGSASFGHGKYQQALKWYQMDLALSELNGNWTDMAATLHNLGHVALEQGDLRRSAKYFAQSRDLYAAFDLTEYVHEETDMIEYIREQDPSAVSPEAVTMQS